jgi:hypothetical protein
LQRHGIGRSPESDGERPKRSVFKTCPICFFGQPYICKRSMEKPETLKLNPVDHTAGPYA